MKAFAVTFVLGLFLLLIVQTIVQGQYMRENGSQCKPPSREVVSENEYKETFLCQM